MENPNDWVAVNWTLPIVVAVVASVVVPAVIALIGTIGKGITSARQLRMELVRDFIRSTAEFESAYRRDANENDAAAEKARAAGAKRFVGYATHKVVAAAEVQTCWRSIAAQTKNLSRNPDERSGQLSLFTRSIAFMNKPSWTFDQRNVEHFPDVLGSWAKRGRMDFKRLEENLNAITDQPNPLSDPTNDA